MAGKPHLAHSRPHSHSLISPSPSSSHYGPSLFKTFYENNALVRNGTIPGVALNFNTLSIGNGIIDEAIQANYYPGEFELC